MVLRMGKEHTSLSMGLLTRETINLTSDQEREG